MANWSSVLIRLAEPFMDAKYTKVSIAPSNEQIPLILVFSSTRLIFNTTCTPPALTLKMKHVSKRMPRRSKSVNRQRRRIVRSFFLPLQPRMTLSDARKLAPAPNFISEVFYLTAAMYHLHFRPVELYLKRISMDSRNYRERIEAVENDPTWRSVRRRPLSFVRPGCLYALDACNRALGQQRSNGLSKLARRSCQRCAHTCRRVMSICSVRRLRSADWDGCPSSLCGCCILSIRRVVIPRSRSGQFRSILSCAVWNRGLMADWDVGYPYQKRFRLRSKLSQSILSKIWSSTGRLSCSA